VRENCLTGDERDLRRAALNFSQINGRFHCCEANTSGILVERGGRSATGSGSTRACVAVLSVKRCCWTLVRKPRYARTLLLELTEIVVRIIRHLE
jgi:hypothetical protein